MYNGKKVAALIAAAGAGNRFAVKTPGEMRQIGGVNHRVLKQFTLTDGEPMYLRAARTFAEHEAVDEIVFIFPEGYSIPDDIDIAKPFTCVAGGDTRQASVRNGIAAVSFARGIVLIHDAARPFVTAGIIDSVIEAAERSGAAVPCVPVTDTLYELDEPESDDENPLTVYKIPDRRQFLAAQTPQGFDLELIREAHEKAASDNIDLAAELRQDCALDEMGLRLAVAESRPENYGIMNRRVGGSDIFEATDDASIAMRYGGAGIAVALGDPINKKITYAADMPGASALPDAYRVGTGFDAHKLAGGRKLILGGVELPFEKGLLGHSDADVLTHALMDALLGALALGDIGKLFPDTDERYRGISSMKLLAEVTELISEREWRVENVDLTVIAERPKISPYREQITASLAEALGVEPLRVSVKATTTEGLGFTGREEGIAAQAVVLLYNNNNNK
jgi:2-C-methyl-D-erythritol 4-phosphate cytidylyltransferase/2-C-methyl-D-erythritol 2,4-cyclodiphosphate synthase